MNCLSINSKRLLNVNVFDCYCYSGEVFKTHRQFLDDCISGAPVDQILEEYAMIRFYKSQEAVY